MLNKLNPEVKAKWLEALRSDRYEQTRGCLQRTAPECSGCYQPAGFCCLGVLCDISGIGSWGSDGTVGKRLAYRVGEDYSTSITVDAVTDWSGLDISNIFVNIEGTVASLPSHNDAGKTFAEIADAIEEQL